jgi:hypothetical protein
MRTSGMMTARERSDLAMPPVLPRRATAARLAGVTAARRHLERLIPRRGGIPESERRRTIQWI